MKVHASFTSFALTLLIAFATGSRLYAQDFDFGDAPDPTYPTLLANNGARHITGQLRMGPFLDNEWDGQPTPLADGDDIDANGDDEDGVTFNTALISGVPGSVTVQCTGVQGGETLQAWIDFNVDGDWDDAGEQILIDYPVLNGPNIINFPVPVFNVAGGSTRTYARFRLSTQMGLSYTNEASYGEVEDYMITLYPLKWLQEPDLTDTGVDVDTDIELADDFHCTQTGPITDIHIWGSYEGDTTPEGLDQGQLNNLTFVLKIWSDVPANPPGGVPYSYPGNLLWQGTFVPGQYSAARVAYVPDGEWWHNPNRIPPADWIPRADFNCYQYDFYINPTNAYSQTESNTYWLGVQVIGNTGQEYPYFGWKSSTNHWNDDAVWYDGAGWQELRYGGMPPNNQHPFAPESMDLSFAVSTEDVEKFDHKMHWPQLPDPHGWDVRACLAPPTDPYPDGLRKILADDFLCTSNGYINHIIFWGSWFSNWFEEASQYQGITNIHLSIHKDIPAAQSPTDYSMPELEPVWWVDFDPRNPFPNWEVFEPMEEEPSRQGWYDPNHDYWDSDNHYRYFRYEIMMPTNEAYFQEEGNIYWLDISVETEFGLWGWKTSRSQHFMDDAVWADRPVTNLTQWKELRDPETYESLDLAFIINEKGPEVDWGDAPDTPYPTLATSIGANHTIVAGMYLGASVDAEPDGQPNANATGDDTNINGLGGTPFPPGDEDGVTFSSLVPGLPATVTITASTAGNLDAWIDYDGNGAWTTPGEQLQGGTIALNPGVNVININVPSTAVPTLSTFARFRFSSIGGLSPTGSAPDGEVEDYEVMIDDLIDWGDAPDPTYPTLSGSGGAAHFILGGGLNPILGNVVDPDLDGQPTPLADGDDLDLQGDDEDGVTWLTPFVPGAVAQVQVVVGGPGGSIDAWFDFDANGTWAHPGERVISTGALIPGSYTFTIPVPTNAAPATNTYSRFRISTAGGLTPGGFAQDGEVEDYGLDIDDVQDIDWGDAPDTPYPTLRANNGAHHLLGPLFLGNIIDNEPDGQPTPNADGDDTDNLYPSLGDDEDGVNLTSLIQPGGYASVDVIASIPGFLDAWVDFENNGTWIEASNRIFNNQPVGAGLNSLIFPVPVTAAQTNAAYARFRLSGGTSAYPAGVSYTGLAMDGEVEDYEYFITPLASGTDWGDAPDAPYPTLSPAGASHGISAGYVLGATIDPEINGQPTNLADGDDTDVQGDDEDGVTFTTKIVAGSNATANVVAGVLGGTLDAWVDFNGNGTWEAGEKILNGVALSPGFTNISFGVPNNAVLGTNFARFRLTQSGIASPGGAATEGEVEDYQVILLQPVPSPDILITNLYFITSNTVARVEWNSQSGITYQMQSTTNLMISNSWMNAGGYVLGPINWQTNSAAPTNQFYRIIAPWTP